MSYIPFFRANAAFLTFGMLMTGFSAFGQTWFIALFSGEIQKEFSLTAGEIGSWYGLATLASGVSLIWLGSWVDRLNLRLMSGIVIGALALSCLSMALIPHVSVLVLVYYLLRLSGQGFMSHVAMTALGRSFRTNRGKALSLGTAGFSIGESFLPFAVVFLMGVIGWKETWAIMAGFLILVLLPCIQYLLTASDRKDMVEQASPTPENTDDDWTRRRVLRDPSFYMIIPNLIAGPFILTGIFFHSVHMATEKGWALPLLAQGLLLFSISSFVATMVIGSMVDRFGAIRLYGFGVWPMLLGFIVLAAGNDTWNGLAYYTLVGITAGFNGTMGSALWAELYGTRHLGAIRSLTSAIMIFGTAGAPALFGWMIDASFTMGSIALLSAVYTGLASLLALITLYRKRLSVSQASSNALKR